LIDGNVGLRSSWRADTFQPWIQADLGREKIVIGIAWGSQLGIRTPATYSFFGSDDGKTWKKIKSVKNYTKAEAIDVFDEPIKARFIKMEIYTTSGGDLVILDEFEAITSKAKKILDYYQDRNILLDDLLDMFKFVSSREDLDYVYQNENVSHWGKLTWETNKTSSLENDQYWLFPYKLSQEEQEFKVQIPEAEIYAGKGQFLKKNITSLSLDFGKVPFIIDVNSFRLIPREKLK
jgi:hypothetical protein